MGSGKQKLKGKDLVEKAKAKVKAAESKKLTLESKKKPSKPVKPAKNTRVVVGKGKKKPPPPSDDDDDESFDETETEDTETSDDFTDSDSDYESSSVEVVAKKPKAAVLKSKKMTKEIAAAKKRVAKLADKQLAKLAEKAAERAAVRAVEKQAEKIRASAAKAARVAGKKRAAVEVEYEDEEEEEEDVAPAVTRRRVGGEADASQVQVTRQRKDSSGRVIERVQVPPGMTMPIEGRRMLKASRDPRVHHERVPGQRGPAVSGSGAVVVHQQIDSRQFNRMFRPGPRAPASWGPEDEARARREEMATNEQRLQLADKLKGLMARAAGSAEEKTRDILGSIGGPGGLVVGQSYDPQPQVAEALSLLSRVTMCRKANPVETVVTLNLTGGRFVAKVWCGGQEVHTEEGRAPNGGAEDPVLRAVRNAAAFVEMKHQRRAAAAATAAVQQTEIPVFTVDEDDDDIDVLED